MLIPNPSSPGPYPEHCLLNSSINRTHSSCKGHRACTRDVLCKGVSLQPSLKLCCINCQMETFPLNFTLFKCIRKISHQVRLRKFLTQHLLQWCWPMFNSSCGLLPCRLWHCRVAQHMPICVTSYVNIRCRVVAYPWHSITGSALIVYKGVFLVNKILCCCPLSFVFNLDSVNS